MELRTIGTALGAAENDLSGDLAPYQRRTILVGLSGLFRDTGVTFIDATEMMLGFLVTQGAGAFTKAERKVIVLLAMLGLSAGGIGLATWGFLKGRKSKKKPYTLSG